MRHNVRGRKLNRTPAHRKMLYRNLVTSLFKYERITTTVPKAKEARILAEKMITFAKKGDLHSRRMAARKLMEPGILQKLFEEIGPRYSERPGGYTRIMRLGNLFFKGGVTKSTFGFNPLAKRIDLPSLVTSRDCIRPEAGQF